jgi:hypothetical protein
MESYNESSSNHSISEKYSETAQALIIVEGACGGLGSLLILITLFHLIFFEKLKSTYLLVQSQVCTYSSGPKDRFFSESMMHFSHCPKMCRKLS